MLGEQKVDLVQQYKYCGILPDEHLINVTNFHRVDHCLLSLVDIMYIKTFTSIFLHIY